MNSLVNSTKIENNVITLKFFQIIVAGTPKLILQGPHYPETNVREYITRKLQYP